MRHVLDRRLARTFDSIHDHGVEEKRAAGAISLRSVLGTARFFAGNDIEFRSIAASAATAAEGDLVVYRIGEACPAQLVADAVARGAAGILSEQVLPCPLPQCIVGDVDLALAEVAAKQFSHPDRKLLTIGVVGSAGKTSTALLVASLFRQCGIRTGYQTDLGDCDGIVQTTSNETVPAHRELIEWIGQTADAGSHAAIIELSDDDARRGGYGAVEFDLLVMTGSVSRSTDYGESGLQCALERLTSSGVVIAPADDPKVMRIVRDSGAKVVTYGIRQAADVTAKIIEQSGGMTTLLVSHGNTTAVMESSLCGAAMAANHAAAAVAGLLVDQPLHEIAEKLGQLREIPGRGQSLDDQQHAAVILDAGGSPERAAAALRTYRSMKSGGRLWCVLAIDAGDHPEQLARYGSLLERFADNAIITSQPDCQSKFLSASHCVLDGVEKCAAMRLVADRQRAVRWAVGEARPTDTVLVIAASFGTSAHQQRSEIDRIQSWVESERRALQEPAEPKILKIADY